LGKVWYRNPAAGLKSSDSLADFGIGTRFNILEPLSGDLELAVPATRPVTANDSNGNGNATRVFFSLAYRY
jgi:hemolysin activation/secretion protein